MKIPHSFRIVLPAMLLCGLHAAEAADIYKYRMPDGSILYTQERQRNAQLLTVIKPQPVDAQAVAARQAALRKIEEDRARADRLAELRMSSAPPQAACANPPPQIAMAPSDIAYGVPIYGGPGIYGGFGAFDGRGHHHRRRHDHFRNGVRLPLDPGLTVQQQPFKWSVVPDRPARQFRRGFHR